MGDIVGLQVDVSTGEVTNEIYTGDKVRITRANSIEYLTKQDDMYIVDSNEEFVKTFIRPLRKLAKCGISKNALLVLAELLPFVRYGTCALVYANGVTVEQKDLPNILDMDKGNVSKVINELKRYDAIAEVSHDGIKQYLINPYIYMKGGKIEPTVYNVFKNSRWYVDGMFRRGKDSEY